MSIFGIFKRRRPAPPLPRPLDRADMVEEMLRRGATGSEIIWALRAIEWSEQFRKMADIYQQMAHNVAAYEADKPRVTKARNHVTKSRVTKRNQRNRAAYMRKYRANQGLRLVTD